MPSDRVAAIESTLRDAFEPSELRIKDQSHLHAGHAGAKDGKGHFAVFLVSQAFRGVRPVQRHQMVYSALSDLMNSDIHALSLELLAPGEARTNGG